MVGLPRDALIDDRTVVAAASHRDIEHRPCRALPRMACDRGGGSGLRRMCDGEKYPDGSYWHEWTWEHGVFGTEWHHDCVSGSSAFPAPPPPGGCAGAIPPA
jgi:hypothetical protein